MGRSRDFLALTKPRVVLMVLVTTTVGFYLGSPSPPDWLRLLPTLLGTALAAGGTIALNQFLERDVDARMERTRRRPLPEGRLRPAEALAFGVAIAAAGLLLLLPVGALPFLVTAATVGLYLFAYTPLKRRSSLCLIVGAVPGALPPVTGWVAARGEFGIGVYITKAEVSGTFGNFSGSTKGAFGLHAGGGVNFNITPTVFLGAEGRYLWAKPSFGGQDIKLDGFTVTADLGFRF